MHRTAYVVLILLHINFMGCVTYTVPRTPTQEAYFTAVDGPLNPTSHDKSGKRGESSSYGILFLVAWGDASIETACRNGEISRIRTVDYSKIKLTIPMINILLFEKYTVKVLGD